MYPSFYGLSRAPFSITPDTHAFYPGHQRGALLQALCFAVSQQEGMTTVIGEVGTGKTLLCRLLPTRLGSEYDWIYLPHPNLSPEQTLQAIATELSIDLPLAPDKGQLMRALPQALLQRHAQGLTGRDSPAEQLGNR